MKILLVNKSDKTGGAAVACRRLHKALLNSHIEAKLLVEDKNEQSNEIIGLNKSYFAKKLSFLHFVSERLYFLPHEQSKEVRFAFSPAVSGRNIHKEKVFEEADIIHLHWINQGFLSLNSLKNIINSGKPIVWTLHDMWAFTGGCHYAGACIAYQQNCGNCPFLKKPNLQDLSVKIFIKKKELLKKANITFVTCSKWLKEAAIKSALLKDFKVIHIPNPIDTHLFYPKDKAKIRAKLNIDIDKKIILFAAANINDKRKGLLYLIEALKQYYHEHKEHHNIEILTFGKADKEVLAQLPYKVHHLGLLSDIVDIVNAYNAADLFALPSLEDNLPNTVMEAMACGTPVLAFKAGGIPEMIEHKQNGYLAEYKSVDDLKKGMEFIFSHQHYDDLSKNAIQKVISEYNEKAVAAKYIQLYKSLLNRR